ncbi:MAG: hypothetical protein HOO88_05870 [Kiritimatiellaceae bacterium]|nr:hypothetical protein [Kiritimatiellaceae bacterium]
MILGLIVTVQCVYSDITVDYFNRADTANASAAQVPSVIGANWNSDTASTWKISGNKLEIVSTTGAGTIYNTGLTTLNSGGTNQFTVTGLTMLDTTSSSASIGLVVNYKTSTKTGVVFRYSGIGDVWFLRPNGTAFLSVPSAFTPVQNRPYRLTVSSTNANQYACEIFDTVTETVVFATTAVNSGASNSSDGYGGFCGTSGLCDFDEFRLKNSVGTRHIDADQKALNGIAGNIYSDTTGAVYNQFQVVTWKQGTVTNPVSWAVGDFTGYYPAGTKTLYQAANSNATYGKSALQIKASTFGVFINSWACPPLPAGGNNIYASYITYRISSPYLYAWKSSSYGASATLVWNFDSSVDTLSATGSALPYTLCCNYMVDTSISKACWLSWRFFDPRGDYIFVGENIGWDAMTATPTVRTMPGGTRYSTTMGYSSSYKTNVYTNWEPFGFSVSRNQIVNIANDLNAYLATTTNTYRYSTNPDDWRIQSVNVAMEMACPNGESDERNCGMKVRNIYLHNK